jgi:hypothetical protein
MLNLGWKGISILNITFDWIHSRSKWICCALFWWQNWQVFSIVFNAVDFSASTHSFSLCKRHYCRFCPQSLVCVQAYATTWLLDCSKVLHAINMWFWCCCRYISWTLP